MQSTVIINCTRGRGGFYFDTSHNITVEGLTVVNCGGVTIYDNIAVLFETVQFVISVYAPLMCKIAIKL